MLKFKNPEGLTRDQLNKIFESGNTDEICDALVSMAFYEDDWKWSQGQCLHFLEHPQWEIRGLAATCLGHVARIHGQLDRELVEAALKKHLSDKKIADRIEFALQDIEDYLDDPK